MRQILVLFFSSVATLNIAQSSRIVVMIEDRAVAFPDTQPVLHGDRVMVPLRGVFERFGATVDWHRQDRRVSIKTPIKTIELTLGSGVAVVNGENQVVDTGPMLFQSRVLVPLRFIAEALDAGVTWRSTSRTVTITPHGM